jgi:hypothetical protein
MLRKTVEAFVNAELAFPPGDRYVYGTMNYDVLGLVIEVVSGQSYEDFMQEQVFKPLGLNNTYLYKEDAQATGRMAQGYRSSFFVTTPFEAPDYAGNKPAGYIISSAQDMARWAGIQIGTIQDIPEIFRVVIAKSHSGNTYVQDVNERYYAAGWQVNTDRTIVEHGGGNPTFSTYVLLFPEDQRAVCLLSNSANANSIGLAKEVMTIFEGNLMPSYRTSMSQILDICLSSATIICCLLAIAFFIFGLRRKKMNGQHSMTKKILKTTFIWLIITVSISIICVVFPMLSVGEFMFVWQTYSILTVLVSLALLTASITWFVYARRYQQAKNKTHD